MRVTEQIDALSVLGVDPVHHLVSPRLLACLGLIPFLTVVANLMGVAGGALISLYIYNVEPAHYWEQAERYVGAWDVFNGLLKSLFFGGALALISCHRGFRGRGGAVGVGRAATEAFVYSFIAILVLDFFLGLFLNSVQELLWPASGARAS
ncbi:MAG TPA: ABC transporter permease, partial [Gemmataceae bacterium]